MSYTRNDITFEEYIDAKLRYFLHGASPDEMSYCDMFEYMYNVESQAMMEVMFLYFILQGKDTFHKVKESFDDYTSKENINQRIENGEGYLFGRKGQYSSTRIHEMLTQDRKELAQVCKIIESLDDEQYARLMTEPTQEYLFDELGLPIRYGKAAHSWRAQNAKTKRPSADELTRNMISTFIDSTGIDISQLISSLSLLSGVSQEKIELFYRQESVLERSDNYAVTDALNSLWREQLDE